jgi:SAM-dependent methyltransferase
MANNKALGLEAHLVCPLSGQPLEPRRQPGGGQALVTPDGNSAYPMESGVYNLIPAPLPSPLGDKAAMWRQLQENGLLSYEMAPFLNLFAAGGPVADDFADFMELRGLVLELGCGPGRQVPAYIKSQEPMVYWGLDPLVGEQPREFPFLLGMAELLPFGDGLFDSLVYCSCLDHMIDFGQALRQAGRVLKPGGCINLALDLIEETGPRPAWRDKMRRGASQTLRAALRKGPLWALNYALTMARLKTPSGASDPFHWHFPTLVAVKKTLAEAGFAGFVEKRRDDMIFLRATKG